MTLLLDTHAFLWFITADSRLNADAKSAIENPSNTRLLSIASLWEMAIKHSLGKLQLSSPLEAFMQKHLTVNSIDLFPIDQKHIFALASLPFHHRDPFDRLIVAQALVENMSIVSTDATLDSYGVSRLW